MVKDGDIAKEEILSEQSWTSSKMDDFVQRLTSSPNKYTQHRSRQSSSSGVKSGTFEIADSAYPLKSIKMGSSYEGECVGNLQPAGRRYKLVKEKTELMAFKVLIVDVCLHA